MNKKKEDHSGIKFSTAFVNDILAAKQCPLDWNPGKR